MIRVPYHEPLYIEGGPWGNGFNGRGDIGLLKPTDRLILYPDDGKACEYIRTTRKWKSPRNGWVHTVFQFVKRVENN